MFKTFNKKYILAMLTALSLNTVNSSLSADEWCCCPPECNDNRFYIGAFGGQLFSNKTEFTQTGVAFFTEEEEGPLAVDARGHSRKYDAGFAGVQIGYEWKRNSGCCSDWSLSTAAELEAFFHRHKHKSHLINPTDRLDEHDFADSFSTNVGVYLANGVFSLNACCLGNFTPYVGVGIGAANLRINKASSFQVEPPEAGVNHFNSDRDDNSWAFAAQAKAGVRYKFCDRFSIFAEYRFLYIDSARFLFGSTVYPDHVPTTTWNVDMKNQRFNSYAVGIQFDL